MAKLEARVEPIERTCDMTIDYANIICDIGAEVARITLNRPPLNILDIAMMQEVNEALERIGSEDGVKLLIVDHQGKAFSAGVDIKDHTPAKVEEMIEVFHGIFRRLSSLPVTTLAVVDGAALGGGCEVATFCDMVVASERSKFGQPEIKVGAFPPVAAVVLPRLIGRNRTMELLLTGDIIDAVTAERIGLVNSVYPTESFGEKIAELVEKLTAASAVVLKLARKAVGPLCAEEEISRVERIYLDELMKTEDAHEGLNAFLEKRSPVWRNR